MGEGLAESHVVKIVKPDWLRNRRIRPGNDVFPEESTCHMNIHPGSTMATRFAPSSGSFWRLVRRLPNSQEVEDEDYD